MGPLRRPDGENSKNNGGEAVCYGEAGRCTGSTPSRCSWGYAWSSTTGPRTSRRAAWLGLLAAELWFAFYWVITQSVRWAPIRRRSFKDRLAARSPPIQPTCSLQYVLLLRDMDRVLFSTYISTFLIFNHLWKTTLLASQINPLHHETSRQKKTVAKLVMFSSRGPLCHRLPLRSRDDHRCHDGTKGRVGT
jgi:hypothetical protein